MANKSERKKEKKQKTFNCLPAVSCNTLIVLAILFLSCKSTEPYSSIELLQFI